MEKIKICYVIGTLEVGGTEKQLLQLIRRMDREKFMPVVIAFRGGVLKEEFERTVKVIVVGKRWKIDLFFLIRLISIIRKEKPDILQTFMFTSNTWGRIAGILSGVPVLISCERSTDLWKKNYHFLIDRILGFFTDKIVCNSYSVKNHYEKMLGQISRKLIVIRNGMDFEEFFVGNVMKPQKKKGKIVLTASRLSYEKGIQFFVEAAKIILEEKKDVRFLIAGEGPLRKTLEEFVKKCCIQDNVTFTGYIKDIQNLIAQSDIVVLPSLWEGLPNIVIEAMAMKKPVVATDVGGTNEIIRDGENGFLVPPGNSVKLAEKIMLLLLNENIAKEFGENAFTFVRKNYDISLMISSYESLYQSLLKRRKRCVEYAGL